MKKSKIKIRYVLENFTPRKATVKWWVLFFAFQILLFLIFSIIIANHASATVENTEVLKGTVEEVQYVRGYGKGGSSRIVLTINGQKCRVSSNCTGDGYHPLINYVKDIRAEAQKGEMFVTVEKEKDILYFWNERKIVDLRSDTTVFFDIEDYNKNMFKEKLLWIVFIFPVFWLFCTVLFLLFILIKNWDADSRTNKKKK